MNAMEMRMITAVQQTIMKYIMELLFLEPAPL